MNHFRLLDTGHVSAATNMALDKIILEEVAERNSPPTLRFLQFKPAAALVGYHQDVNLELRLDYCKSHGIDINRRLTGGGSIYFQESALGWEIFGNHGEEPFRGTYESILYKICTVAALGLSRLGLPARFRPRNDIEVNGRKVSGTGGVMISNAFMFQGTVLVTNEVDQFLKALRVPVEKLKKREIESLMERMCFLSDLLSPAPTAEKVKHELTAEFQHKLGINLRPGELTPRERNRLKNELPYYNSHDWIMAKSRPVDEGEPIRSITQTRAGTLRSHLWVGPGGKRVRKALIAGDFFTVPQRLTPDLEASLVGQQLRKESLASAVESFLDSYDGQFLGISTSQVAQAITHAAAKLQLKTEDFSYGEINELFLVNVEPNELHAHRPRWLLLPYCSKNLDCEYRDIPGCDRCGFCEIGECCELAESFDMNPITIQSFEHRMEVLRNECEDREGLYVGSCCEAFYAKHQEEMKAIRARGLLINLDSTTCYDLGKGTMAYKGHFDNKTDLNMELIRKVLGNLHANRR